MGRLDQPLNEVGKAQVQKAAQALIHLGIQAIVSSPLSRAQQSARIIQEFLGPNVPVKTEHWLTERALGPLEGEIKTPQNRAMLNNHEGVETIVALAARLQRVYELFDGAQNTLIVSHSGVYQCLIDELGLKPVPSQQHLKNAEYVTLFRSK